MDALIVFVVVFVLAVVAAAITGWRTYEYTWGSKGDPRYRQPCVFCGGPTREPYHRFRAGSICDDCVVKRKTRKVMMTPTEARRYRGKTVPPSFLVDVEEDEETS